MHKTKEKSQTSFFCTNLGSSKKAMNLDFFKIPALSLFYIYGIFHPSKISEKSFVQFKTIKEGQTYGLKDRQTEGRNTMEDN